MRKYLRDMVIGEKFTDGVKMLYEFIGYSTYYHKYYAYDQDDNIVSWRDDNDYEFDMIEPKPKTGIPTKETLEVGDRIVGLGRDRTITGIGDTKYLFKCNCDNNEYKGNMAQLHLYSYYDPEQEILEFMGKKYFKKDIIERISKLKEIN